MRFMRVGAKGSERPAVLDGAGIVRDLSGLDVEIAGGLPAPGSRGAIERAVADGSLPALGEWTGSGAFEMRDGRRVGAPLHKPEKIVCIGLNYKDHASETGSPIPTEPVVFMKAPNCLVGPYDEILVPRLSQKTDWEVELAVVIGARARYLGSPDDAPSVIAGYAISNDVSEREFQTERGGQWVKGKSCETFNPFGPWVATRDEIADPQSIGLELAVNGTTRQNGTTANMIFGVNHVVWYLSQFMVLEPGDIVNTGTPAGVSLGHPDVPFLTAGDVVELAADGLGRQRCRVGQA
ncbi:MAG: fumarylacetoacetate hydrolase family protein [Actinomycetota bacterium]|nr:fumarylacetoacetate hydrolase family protein [Actinomycetota bacterium]